MEKKTRIHCVAEMNPGAVINANKSTAKKDTKIQIALSKLLLSVVGLSFVEHVELSVPRNV